MSRESNSRWTTLIMCSIILFGTPSDARTSEINLDAVPRTSVTSLSDELYADPTGQRSIWLSPALDPWQQHQVTFVVPEPGDFHLDISVPATAPVLASILNVQCDVASIIEREPNRWRLAVLESGECQVTIGQRDPLERLDAYRLDHRLETFERSLSADKDELDDGGESDEEIEIEPDLAGWIVLEATTLDGFDKDELDDGGESDEEIEIEPDLARVDGSVPLTGVIDGPWGLDRDVFIVELREAQVVKITTQGDTDTAGALFDSSGRRLASDDDSGEGRNFSMLQTLPAGTYRVRVEGAVGSPKAEGKYGLYVEVIATDLP